MQQNLKETYKNLEEVTNAVIMSLIEIDENKNTVYCKELSFNEVMSNFLDGLELPYMSFKTIGLGSNVYVVAGVYNWADIDLEVIKTCIEKYSKKIVFVINQKGCGFSAIQKVFPNAHILKRPTVEIPVESKAIEKIVESGRVIPNETIEVTKEAVEQTLVEPLTLPIQTKDLPRFWTAGTVANETSGVKLGCGVLYPNGKEWKGVCNVPELVSGWAFGAEVYAAAIAVSGANSLKLPEIEVAVTNETLIQMATGKIAANKPAAMWLVNAVAKFQVKVNWVLVTAEENLAKQLAKDSLA